MFHQKSMLKEPLSNSIKSSRSLNDRNNQSRSPNIISTYLEQRWNTKDTNLSEIKYNKFQGYDTQKSRNINQLISFTASYNKENNTLKKKMMYTNLNLKLHQSKVNKSDHLSFTETNNPMNFVTFNKERQIESHQYGNKRDSLNIYPESNKSSNQPIKPRKQLSSYLMINQLKKSIVTEQSAADSKPLLHSSTQRLQSVHLNLVSNQISMDQIKIESMLGSGSYATVKLGRHIHSNEKYALKIYDKQKMQDPQKLSIINKEITILKTLNHPSIIKLHSVIEDSKNTILILEYVSSLSLQSYVKTKYRMAEREAKKIFQQLMDAVHYLHDRLIAHRDIKMDNILMQSNNHIKLIDFGFATTVYYGQKSSVYCGTPNYMSPEMSSKIPHNPQSSDIWSCGILLYTLLCGEHPFKASNNRDLAKKIQNGVWKIPDGLQVSLGAMKILKACLDKNIDKRWTADQIINDEWLKQ